MEMKPTLDQAFNSASIGILSTDRFGNIAAINQQASEIIGIQRQKIIGTNISEHLKITARLIHKCLRSGKPQIGRHIRGKRIKLVASITPIQENGYVLGAVCCFEKMYKFEQTARKLESYQRLNKQFETIFNSSSDGIWVVDGNGKVIAVNQAAEKFSNIKAADVMNKNVVKLVESGIIDRALSPEVLASKRQVNMLQYIEKTRKYILSTGTPAFDENGNVFLVVVNERDMTRLNELLEQLDQTRLVSDKYKDKLTELGVLELKKQEIIAESEEMQQVLRVALKLAQMEASNILIQGESGTGKGLLAKFIHRNSPRRDKPFIQINCATIPENLLEAELFGYEKGAFTGAHQKGKAGLLELAHGGTFFLDEIGDIPYVVQAKLLKCIEDQKIMHLGGLKPIQINCMIIVADNKDLAGLVKEKKFREDLFYRLNAFSIKIPALRDRPDDTFELANYFLHKYNEAYKADRQLSYSAIEILQSYPFPGNVRELKNLIKKAVVLSEDRYLDEFIQKSLGYEGPGEIRAAADRDFSPSKLTVKLNQTESKMLKTAVMQCKSTREIARYLGISQPSVVRKLKKYGISQSN
ncbi:MAG: sigma 54-interacting transcriptional regulator [Desulfobacterales bacterium]|jgi:PAS domain S-box-containing protein